MQTMSVLTLWWGGRTMKGKSEQVKEQVRERGGWGGCPPFNGVMAPHQGII